MADTMIPSLLLSNLPVDPLVLKSSKSIRTNEFSRGMGMEELDLVRGGSKNGCKADQCVLSSWKRTSSYFFFLFAIIEPPFSSQNRPLKIVGLCNRTHQPMNYTNNSPRRSGIVNGNGYSNHPPTIIETAFSVAINAPPFLSLSFSLSLFRPTESGPLFLFSISRAGQGRGNL